MPRAGLTEFPGRPSLAPSTFWGGAFLARNGTIMKKVALTVAVLALGLAACESRTADAVDNTAVENAVEADAMAADNSVDNALDAAGNTTGEDVANSIENGAEATGNAAENAANSVDNAM